MEREYSRSDWIKMIIDQNYNELSKEILFGSLENASESIYKDLKYACKQNKNWKKGIELLKIKLGNVDEDDEKDDKMNNNKIKNVNMMDGIKNIEYVNHNETRGNVNNKNKTSNKNKNNNRNNSLLFDSNEAKDDRRISVDGNYNVSNLNPNRASHVTDVSNLSNVANASILTDDNVNNVNNVNENNINNNNNNNNNNGNGVVEENPFELLVGKNDIVGAFGDPGINNNDNIDNKNNNNDNNGGGTYERGANVGDILQFKAGEKSGIDNNDNGAGGGTGQAPGQAPVAPEGVLGIGGIGINLPPQPKVEEVNLSTAGHNIEGDHDHNIDVV